MKKGFFENHMLNIGLPPISTTRKFSPKFPIYIPSKGRAGLCHTVNLLDKDKGIKDFLVFVEPQDLEPYSSELGKDRLVILDKNDMGVSYVRNYIKDFSIKAGDKWHWQLDDNISYFTYRDEQLKGKRCAPSRVLFSIESFCLQYYNIAASSPSHTAFFSPNTPEILFNKQVFSCVLINNSTPVRWRDDCVEDTDYSLQCLSLGWVTVKFSHLQMAKPKSGIMSGGHNYSLEYRTRRSVNTMKFWPGAFKMSKETGKLLPSRVWGLFKQIPKNLEDGSIMWIIKFSEKIN